MATSVFNVPTVIYMATRTLSHAEIIALPNTPLTLVPSAGSTKGLLPTFAVLNAHLVTAYTNVKTDATLYVWQSGDLGSNFILSPILNDVTDGLQQVTILLAGGTGDLVVSVPPAAQYSNDLGQTVPVGVAVNKSVVADAPITLYLQNSHENLTGGNAANTLTVSVWYVVVDL